MNYSKELKETMKPMQDAQRYGGCKDPDQIPEYPRAIEGDFRTIPQMEDDMRQQKRDQMIYSIMEGAKWFIIGLMLFGLLVIAGNAWAKAVALNCGAC